MTSHALLLSPSASVTPSDRSGLTTPTAAASPPHASFSGTPPPPPLQPPLASPLFGANGEPSLIGTAAAAALAARTQQGQWPLLEECRSVSIRGAVSAAATAGYGGQNGAGAAASNGDGGEEVTLGRPQGSAARPLQQQFDRSVSIAGGAVPAVSGLGRSSDASGGSGGGDGDGSDGGGGEDVPPIASVGSGGGVVDVSFSGMLLQQGAGGGGRGGRRWVRGGRRATGLKVAAATLQVL